MAITDRLLFRSEGFTTLIGAELHTDGMDFGNGWHMGLPVDETGPQRNTESENIPHFIRGFSP